MVTVDRAEFTTYSFVIKTGSTSPNLSATLTDEEDDAVDLTGSTVRFRMETAGADSPKVDEQAVITNATGGVVEYSWSESDTDTRGHFNGEFAVDYDGQTGSNFDADESFPSNGYLDVKVVESL